jgi:quinol monooxygenase YgiN
MPDRLIIIAHFVARPGRIEAAATRLQAMIAPTRAEPGCVEYRLHQDMTNPAEFTFFEVFAGRAAWELHMQARVVADIMTDMDTFFVGMPQIREMAAIG